MPEQPADPSATLSPKEPSLSAQARSALAEHERQLRESDASSAADGDFVAPLRIPLFRRLWVALGLSSFGDWLATFATIAFAHSLGDSYTESNVMVAIALATKALPGLFLGPLAGVFADRFSRRTTMIWGDLIRAGLFLSVAIIGTYGWLLIATVFVEIAAIFWGPAKDATTPNLVPKRRLETANQISLATTYGVAIPAALAWAGMSLLAGVFDGFLTAPGGLSLFSLAMYVNAATFTYAAFTIWRIHLPQESQPVGGSAPSMWQSMAEGWAYVSGKALIRGLVLGMIGAFAAGGLVVGLAKTYATDLGGGEPGFSALAVGVFAGLAAGFLISPRLFRGFSRYRLFGLSLMGAGLMLAITAIFPNLVVSVISLGFVGVFVGSAWVTGQTLVGQEVEDRIRGRVMGFLTTATRVVLALSLALGPLLVGPIGRPTIPYSPTWSVTYSGAAVVFFIAALVAMLMGWVSYRHMDDRPGMPLYADFFATVRTSLGLPEAGRSTLWSALGLVRGVSQSQGEAELLPQERGRFLVFEGGDGCGKSTQAQLLAQWLRDELGHEVLTTREPGATGLGTQLRELLLHQDIEVFARTEALLFAADRAQHVHEVITPAMQAGQVVISDRYIDSSVAYQGAGQALDPDHIARLSRWATEGLEPHLTILLDLPTDVARARMAADTSRAKADRMESFDDDFHRRVREGFLARQRLAPHRYLVVNASQSPEQIHEQVRQRVREVLPLSAAREQQRQERLDEVERSWQVRAAAHDTVQDMHEKIQADDEIADGAQT